jgi:lactate dehydrogenase-like 2-hydroxyacid dehydrogenase
MSITGADGHAAAAVGILEMPPLLPALVERVREHYRVLTFPSSPAERAAFLTDHGECIEVLVVPGPVGAKAELINSLPALRAIVNVGVGYDSIDLNAARSRNIMVSNTPDVLNSCVADLAIGLLLDIFRHISASDRFIRRGEWLIREYPLTTQFSHSRVGIVGLGRIGREIAHRLEAFGVDIMYFNRRQLRDSPYTYVPDPVQLARRCNALVISTSGGAATKGLISREVLEALGPAGYLVNVSRGSVVDEAALVSLLAQGRLAGAGLDVFAREPSVPEDLFALDNVVIVPHIGSATRTTRAAMNDLAFQNLKGFLETGKLVTPVP